MSETERGADNRSIVCAVVGPALFWAWNYTCFSTRLIYQNTSAGISTTDLGFILSQVFVILAAGLLMVFHNRSARVLSTGSVLVSSLLLTAFTLFLWVTNGIVPAVPTSLMVVISIIIGGAFPPLPIAWGARQTLAHRRLPLVVIASFLLAYLLFYATLALPQPLSTILASIMPLLSAVIWLLDRKRSSLGGKENTPSAHEMTEGVADPRLLPWGSIILFCVTCFMGELVAFILVDGESDLNMIALGAGTLFNIALGVLAVIIYRRSPNSVSLDTLYLYIGPLITAILLVQILVGGAATPFTSQLLHASTLLLQMMLWLLLAQVTEQEGVSPLMSFGLVLMLLSFITAGANIGSNIIRSTSTDLSQTALWLCCAFILLIASSLSLLLLLAIKKLSSYQQTCQSSREPASTTAHPQDGAQEAWEQALADKCQRFGNAYALSPRETEVFGYLMRGFTAPHIGSALYVTTGTVKTHTAHIYHKLAVNSREQAINLFDGFETR